MEEPVNQQVVQQPQQPVHSLSGMPRMAIIAGTIALMVLIGIGGYIFGQKSAQPLSTKVEPSATQAQSEPTTIPSPTIPLPATAGQKVTVITPTTDPSTHWNTYTIADLGLQFSLPPQVYSGQGDFKEAIGKGQAGTEMCIYFAHAEVASNNNKSGGQCWTNDNDVFVMGGDSVDFEAGRSGTFMDTLGFTQKGNTFSENLNLNRQSDLTPYNPQKVSNVNGVSIIKIKGTSQDPQNPYSGIGETLSNGWFGALVNTKKTDYPGIGVQIKLSNGITEPLFDQILSSFKFQ